MKPELTFKSLVLGILLAVVLGAANLYLGVKVGMTVSASIPAAVIAMLVFRRIGGSILEANQVQTAASASESLAAGLVFTVPAMVMVGLWQDFNYWEVVLIGFCGGVLGVIMMIPMRKIFIVDKHGELPYPEAVACEKILRAGMQAGNEKQANYVLGGALFGAVHKVLGSVFGLFAHTLEGAKYFGSSCFYLGGEVSLAIVGIGIIVRLHTCLLVLLGAAIGWWLYLPSLTADLSILPLDFAWSSWSTKVRFIGVGAMIVAGVASIIEVRKGLYAAVQVLFRGDHKGEDDLNSDLPKVVLLSLSLLMTVILGAYYYGILGEFRLTAVTLLFIVVLGFLFSGVSSYVVGIVGNSNNPISGMVISALLITGFFILLLSVDGPRGMMATLGVAAVVGAAVVSAGDMAHDLKTGFLVGSSPRKQQIMQIIGIAVAAFVLPAVLQLLHHGAVGGIGGKELPAPQSALLSSLVQGMFGGGGLDRMLVMGGVAIGLAVLAIDFLIARSGGSFRFYLMPVAVGIYLPLPVTFTMCIGGILGAVIEAQLGKEKAESDFRRVLLSSGLIAGESLAGVAVAMLAAMQVTGMSLLEAGWLRDVLTYGSLGVTVAVIYRLCGRQPSLPSS